jgi:hypothetical protein
MSVAARKATLIRDCTRRDNPAGPAKLFHLHCDSDEVAWVLATGQWVIPTGGGYFFVPAVSALGEVIAR